MLRICIRYILFIFALLYSASFVLWSQQPDIAYWMNRSHLFYQDFMCPMTLFIGNIWINLTGHEAVTYRMLGWLLCMVSITYVYLSNQKREDWGRNLNCLSLGIVIFGGFTFQFYNPDSTTVLFLTLLAVYALKHKLNDFRELLLASFLTALAISCRFPNIVALVFVCIYMLLMNLEEYRYNKIWAFKNVALYTCSTFVIYYILLVCLCQRFDIWSMAKESLSATQSSAETSHSMSHLLMNNVFNSVAAWVEVSACVAYVLFLRMLGLSKSSPKWMQWLLPLGIFFLFWYPARVGIFETLWIGYFRTAAFAAAFFLLYKAKCSGGRQNWINAVFIICIALSASAGSDDTILKMYGVMMAFLPIPFCYFKKEFDVSPMVKSYTLGVVLAAMSGYLSPLSQNTTALCLPNNHLQYVSREAASIMHDRYNEYKQYCPNGKALFYGGLLPHRMYQITSIEMPYFCGYWQSVENSEEVAKLIECLKKDPSQMLFVYDKSECAGFEQALCGVGYHLSFESESTKIYRHI